MKLENAMLATLLFAAVIYGGTGFYGGVADQYATTHSIDDSTYAYRNTAGRTMNLSNSAMGQTDSGLSNSIARIPIVGTVYSGIQIVFGTIKALFGVTDIMSSMILTLSQNIPLLGVDVYFIQLLYAAIGISVLFAILYLILKVRG